jgi:uncharacterized membrane protein
MTNRWKGFVVGAAGSAAGVLAMRAYWQVASILSGGDPRQQTGNPEPQALDDISVVGTHHEQGESSTAAMGRIAYELIAGKPPASEETRTTLSYLVHWGYSMLMGGLYGALRGRARWPDAKGGLGLGLGVWGLGDELATPLLGLAKGPTAYPPALHAHAFGAHVAYGLASAAATQALLGLTGERVTKAARHEKALTRIERSIDIARDADAVFAVLTDLDRLPDWATIVVETHDLPGRPMRNGDTFRQTIRLGGQTLETEWEVSELRPGRHVAYTATAPGGGELAMKQTVIPNGRKSRVEVELDYAVPGGFLGELADRAYMERRNEREAELSLHNLKDLLEAGSPR